MLIDSQNIAQFTEQQWFQTKELLSVTESQELFSWITKRQELMKPARIGSQEQKTQKSHIRSDSILWIEPESDPVFKIWNQRINEISKALSEVFLLSIKSHEFHFAHYPSGSHYSKHIDQPQSSHNRLISVVHYLNPEWKSAWGGQIVLYTKNGPIKIEPESPTTLFFQSHKMEHEVRPTEKDRFSLTGWLLG